MSKRFITLAALALLFSLQSASTPTYAHDPSTGAPPFEVSGFGTATIDGTMSPGEWDSAGTVAFEMFLPPSRGGGRLPATLYVMNDANNLYFAVRFAGIGFSTVIIQMDFDNLHNAVFDPGAEDGFVVGRQYSNAPGYRDLVRLDVSSTPGDADWPLLGTNDGSGTVGEDATHTTVEVSKPLNSGEALDFALSAGDTVGARFSFSLDGVGAGFPLGNIVDQTTFGDIHIEPLATQTAPVFDEPVTPACGDTFDHVALKELTFPVSASDADPGGVVTLEAVTLPPGATLTLSPPTGNPAAGVFAWTPTVADADNNPHTIHFRATDDTGLTDDCTMTVNVLGDTDGDGLPDAWEMEGYTYNSEFVDLPSMGADPNVKDVFVEIDYMVEAGHTHRPLGAAVDAIKQAFANRGIVLHVNVDEALTHQDVLGAGSSGANYNWTDFDATKAGSFSEARSLAIHYCLFVHNIPTNGGTDSGLSRGIGASDFIVSLGSFTNQVGSQAEQAGTFMHELGHNLKLKHGGGDDVNRKANYISVMNYFFQMNGLRKNGAFGVFDYSGARLPTLLESGLDETAGLGPTAPADLGTRWVCASTGETMTTDSPNGPIDWDCDGSATEASVSVDINGDGVRFIPLQGFDDWPNLDFKVGTIGTGIPLPQPSETPAEELTREQADTLRPDGPVKVNGHVSAKKLHLTWKPAGLKKDGVFYRVYRSADGGDPVLLGETATTEYDDNDVAAGVAYVYTVTWVDALGTESKPSVEIALTLK